MKPGTIQRPLTSTVVAPSGTFTLARGPTATIRDPEMTRTPSAIGGPPLPSTIVAPVSAKMEAGACAIGDTPSTSATAADSEAKRRFMSVLQEMQHLSRQGA